MLRIELIMRIAPTWLEDSSRKRPEFFLNDVGKPDQTLPRSFISKFRSLR